jgi:hypothetical protein
LWTTQTKAANDFATPSGHGDSGRRIVGHDRVGYDSFVMLGRICVGA